MRRLFLKSMVAHFTSCPAYMLVCGDKEVAVFSKVAVRTRRGKDLGSMDVNEVIEKLQQEIRSRSPQQLEEI